ncbi:S8 family peptidase [Ekhidna sp.]|uniref:S8 family peptidase n=1 Tax=Ekhidna sp. TaxID=2608089 RepID=UPI003B50A0DF
MRGVVISLLMIVLWDSSHSQNPNHYIDYITSALGHDVEIRFGKYYLIEGNLSDIKDKYLSLEIIKSYDSRHHIVYANSDLMIENKLWNINDHWKLDLAGISSTQYYVITKGGNGILSKEFEILKSYPSSNTYLVEGSLKDIKEKLLPQGDVLHITDKVVIPRVEARVIDLNLNPNRVNKIHHLYPELNGSTELVSLQENQFRDDDIDLINRSQLSGLESEFVDNHATEMATIIGGAGNSFVTGKGVARDASLTSSDFADAMPDSDQAYIDMGIIVQNHSYGINRTNEYGVQARAFDISAFANRNLLHVFSSGNEGLEVSTDGQYQGIEGYANLTGNIKMAKNTLVVGSVDTVGNIPSFVSKGPTYDGRVKPEVVSYSVVGSSNSAALVSGITTLLQQQYREDNGGQDMPSALVKALLINGAEDVGPKGPDFLTGYGNVNAWNSLQSLRNSQFASGTIANGDTDTFIVNIPSNVRNLKVTLVWTDPAANIGDFKALVNDLDLRLDDGSSETLPWILDPSPNISSLSSEAERGIDTLNNVEQVTIANPASTYTIEVDASSIISDQEYFVTWQYEIENQFEWDFPTGSDNMPYNGETGSYFRWSTTKEGIGAFSYTLDGNNWILLDDGIDLSEGYWRWDSPPSINGAVKAKMTIGSEAFETDTFTVSVPLKASVGFNCADSLMIKWDQSDNAVNYIVSSLGEKRMEELTNTSDTFLIISEASSLGDTRISIQPVLNDENKLLPTPTFDFTRQGVECYVSTFFQTVSLDTGIYLNLTLGTFYGIESIQFQRNNFNGYTTLASFDDVSSDELLYLDAEPIQGYNEHRAIIRFINGEMLTLYSGSVYYLTEIPLKIFPNPVQSGDFFTVITKEFEDRTPLLEVVDQQGALVHKQEIQGSQDVIPTGGMQSGIYYYRMKADGKIYTGRILIR